MDSKVVVDFTKSEYYEYYLNTISKRSQQIMIEVMNSNNNDKKYTRDDVLKLVFKFVETQLREFPESLDVNPTRESQHKKQVNESVKRETSLLLWIESDISE